jgi:hypothetical protein
LSRPGKKHIQEQILQLSASYIILREVTYLDVCRKKLHVSLYLQSELVLPTKNWGEIFLFADSRGCQKHGRSADGPNWTSLYQLKKKALTQHHSKHAQLETEI